MIQRRVFVSGRVQGVGYRVSAVRMASRYPGLKGFVRNLADGRVEALFVGDSASVLSMIRWCGHGPSFADVTGVEVQEEPVDPALPDWFTSK